jgi:hypothetical protein
MLKQEARQQTARFTFHPGLIVCEPLLAGFPIVVRITLRVFRFVQNTRVPREA